MSWELRNLLGDIELVKEKIEDVLTTFTWFDDGYFVHSPKHVLNMEEIKAHGYRYHEHRIQNRKTIDLMLMYMKEFNDLINKFHEIEKASSGNFDERSDNA